MSTTEKQKRLYWLELVIKQLPGSTSSQVLLHPCYFERERGVACDPESGRQRVPIDSRSEESELADFVISAWCSADNDNFRAYGWELAYSNPHSVDLRRAKLMAAFLGRVERKLDIMIGAEGQPANFGQYVNRVMRILGIVGIVERAEHQGVFTGYSTWKVGEAPGIINHRIDDLRRKAAEAA